MTPADRPGDEPPAGEPAGAAESGVLVGGRVLDASAVRAWMRGWQHMRALVEMAGEHGVTLLVPAGVITEAAWHASEPASDGLLDEFLDMSAVVVSPLDRKLALALGHPSAQVPRGDITDAHVYALATARDWAIVTDTPNRYRVQRHGHLEAEVELIPPPEG